MPASRTESPGLGLSPFHLRRAVDTLYRGGVIAYPTEAVYGLGCEPLNADAVYRLLEMKQRPVDKGLILVAANLEQLTPYLQPLSPAQVVTIQATWPGPVTWVIPCLPSVPPWLRGRHRSLAVRVSAHPLVQALCTHYGGAIVSTSANISARPPARSPLTVQRVFAGGVDYCLHASLGEGRRPTEIRSLISGETLRSA